jgi:hypothetical protein
VYFFEHPDPIGINVRLYRVVNRFGDQDFIQNSLAFQHSVLQYSIIHAAHQWWPDLNGRPPQYQRPHAMQG